MSRLAYWIWRFACPGSAKLEKQLSTNFLYTGFSDSIFDILLTFLTQIVAAFTTDVLMYEGCRRSKRTFFITSLLFAIL